MKLTIKIKEGKNGFLIGQIKEIPPVLTQGKTIEEVKENILDALELYLEGSSHNSLNFHTFPGKNNPM